MCESDNPLPGFGDTWTDVLTADEQEDGAGVGYKVVANNKISLLPVGGVLVVGVIKDLFEVGLFLIEELVDFRLFAE